MAFLDIHAYGAHLRRQLSSATAIVFALAFDPSATYLLVATTTGLLKIYSIPEITDHLAVCTTATNPLAVHDLSAHGAINSLQTTNSSVYVATDDALLRITWQSILSHAPDFTTLVPRLQINALATLPDQSAVIVASANGSFLAVSDSGSHPMPLGKTLGSSAYPHCLASNPADVNTFLAGCDDGVIRHYDVRTPKRLAREVSLQRLHRDASQPYITALAINQDGTFALAADSGYHVSSVHLHTGSIVSSASTPFLPQALGVSRGVFYCGGSDRLRSESPSRDNSLLQIDVQGREKGVTPVSASAVYAMATSTSGMITAGGYSSGKGGRGGLGELVDVYCDPPVRSFSVHV